MKMEAMGLAFKIRLLKRTRSQVEHRITFAKPPSFVWLRLQLKETVECHIQIHERRQQRQRQAEGQANTLSRHCKKKFFLSLLLGVISKARFSH